MAIKSPAPDPLPVANFPGVRTLECREHEHDRPGAPTDEPRYVWVTTVDPRTSCAFVVERYVLLDRTPAGGAKVVSYRHSQTIRKAEGRHFFFDEAAILAYLRQCANERLDRLAKELTVARDDAAMLARVDALQTNFVRVVPDERTGPERKLVL